MTNAYSILIGIEELLSVTLLTWNLTDEELLVFFTFLLFVEMMTQCPEALVGCSEQTATVGAVLQGSWGC